MEEFERIKKLVESSNKYCLYVELEDIKTLIRIIDTMNKKAKLKSSIIPEEYLKNLEDFIFENYSIDNIYPANYKFFESLINITYNLRKKGEFKRNLSYIEIADFILEIRERKKKELNEKYGIKTINQQ